MARLSRAKAGRWATAGRSIRPISSSRTNCISSRGRLERSPGLYEAAIDQLASRGSGENRVRPKIVASTATVRRAADQIAALFDRSTTSIFPPPGIDRVDSFFARTVPSTTNPARLYLGIAAQGRGPKLVFLRSLTTLVAAAQAAYDANVPADARYAPFPPATMPGNYGRCCTTQALCRVVQHPPHSPRPQGRQQRHIDAVEASPPGRRDAADAA